MIILVWEVGNTKGATLFPLSSAQINTSAARLALAKTWRAFADDESQAILRGASIEGQHLRMGIFMAMFRVYCLKR